AMTAPTLPVNYGKALYYPYIHVRDENWLKAALLYWDGLRRIIPPSLGVLDDSVEVQKVVDAGLLERAGPLPYCDGAGKRFRNALLPLLGDRRRMKHLRRGSTVEDLRRPNVELHIDKLSHQLHQQLESEGLTKQSGEWLTMERSLGDYYMLCLAAEMSQEMRSPLLTDKADYQLCGEYFSFGQPPPIQEGVLSRARRWFTGKASTQKTEPAVTKTGP